MFGNVFIKERVLDKIKITEMREMLKEEEKRVNGAILEKLAVGQLWWGKEHARLIIAIEDGNGLTRYLHWFGTHFHLDVCITGDFIRDYCDDLHSCNNSVAGAIDLLKNF